MPPQLAACAFQRVQKAPCLLNKTDRSPNMTTTVIDDRPTKPAMLRGFRRKCPNCGQGNLFTRIAPSPRRRRPRLFDDPDCRASARAADPYRLDKFPPRTFGHDRDFHDFLGLGFVALIASPQRSCGCDTVVAADARVRGSRLNHGNLRAHSRCRNDDCFARPSQVAIGVNGPTRQNSRLHAWQICVSRWGN